MWAARVGDEVTDRHRRVRAPRVIRDAHKVESTAVESGTQRRGVPANRAAPRNPAGRRHAHAGVLSHQRVPRGAPRAAAGAGRRGAHVLVLCTKERASGAELGALAGPGAAGARVQLNAERRVNFMCSTRRHTSSDALRPAPSLLRARESQHTSQGRLKPTAVLQGVASELGRTTTTECSNNSTQHFTTARGREPHEGQTKIPEIKV